MKLRRLIAGASALLMASSLAMVTGCSKGGAVDVGIVLPTKDEPRWIQDEAQFLELLKGNASVQLLFSQGDSNKEKQNVEALLNKGIKILIICPHDATAAAAAVEAAKKDGVTVICYDRLITDTDAVDYYVTFDSVSVGEAQGQFLIDSIEPDSKGNPLYLYAGAASDNNAFLFFEGAWKALQPKIADGTFVIKNSDKAVALQNKNSLSRTELSDIINQVTTDWNFDVAKKKAADNLTMAKASDKGACYVLAPNDGTARAISDEFSKDPAVTSFVITGQDAELASQQYIVDGRQSMTVWKNTSILAADAVAMATQVLDGTIPETTSTYDNGKIEVPAKQTAVTVITKDNIDLLVDANYNGAKTQLRFE
ncbi:MAG: sugar-binding protein [Treponemataceae bacterium]|nr:sugar-binding protein [Treponemataceae bacterium]